MKKYDIFLLDADRTLYDFDTAEAIALKAAFDFFGFGFTESVLSLYREISEQVWASFEKGEITIGSLQSLRFSLLFDDIGILCDAKGFNQKYHAELGKGTFLNDGALEICKEITDRNKEIFIVTNGIYQVQKARISRSPIKENISGYFVSEAAGFQKPDIGYFEYVFSRIPAVGKDRIIIVGDSLTADIAGGNNARIDTCWFNERKTENHTGIKPTYEINKLSELARFI